MLSKEDEKLIEKFVGCELNIPDTDQLTKKEQILWDERMNDSDFVLQLQLERELHENLSKQSADEIALKENLKNILLGKNFCSKLVQKRLR